MNEYDLVLFLHLSGVLLFVAGIAVAGAASETARRQATPAEIALLLRMSRIGVLLVAAGSLLLGIFGLWLVHLGGFGYGTGWIDASVTFYLIALVLGGLGGQRPKQARRLAARLQEENGPVSAELRGLLDDRFSRTVNLGALLDVIAIVALMVFKP